jgi:hypothetical protein
MIDALVKGGGYTLEEMMNHLANTGRIENPELVRRMGKGQR